MVTIIHENRYVIIKNQNMETKTWKCKNCNEEVDENFNICWNCSAGSDGIIEEKSKTMFDEIKNEVRFNKDEGKRIMVNPFHIVGAGKSLKDIVYALILLMICQVIGGLISFTSNDKDIILVTSVLISLLSLIFLVFVLFRLYSAANYLENSVKGN